jgi:hypothetical protein
LQKKKIEEKCIKRGKFKFQKIQNGGFVFFFIFHCFYQMSKNDSCSVGFAIIFKISICVWFARRFAGFFYCTKGRVFFEVARGEIHLKVMENKEK